MGRKSAAAEKKSQIVEKFAEVVLDLGIERASMGEVASRVGIDRSTMHYYFRAREDLVIEVAKYISNHYVERMQAAVERLNPRDKARSLVELLFSPGFHDDSRSALIDELSALGNREPFFQEQVKSIYAALEAVTLQAFDESLPGVPLKERRAAAHAIGALAEGASVYSSIGFSTSHRLASRQLALKVLDELAERSANAKAGAQDAAAE
jgi:AcrR family transcriptional regulator